MIAFEITGTFRKIAPLPFLALILFCFLLSFLQSLLFCLFLRSLGLYELEHDLFVTLIVAICLESITH